MSKTRLVQVFEHESLSTLDDRAAYCISGPELDALERYHGRGTPYFSLIRQGVKFNEHVGVLQAGNLTIEVLPKADNNNPNPESWQRFLITMLRAAGIFPEASSTASLKLRNNSILDLYMQLFLQEVQYLIQTGLVRKYRKSEGNTTALKGSLRFAENIRHNLTHAERFYVRHTVYDRNNNYNAILLKALELVKGLSNQPATVAAASTLLLDFPECDDVKLSEAFFGKLSFDRKTEGYRTAIGIAKLLLLRFHPDVRQGTHDVLALMFDMNALWEKYVFRMLRRKLDPTRFRVSEQVRNDFWLPESGYMRTVRPDIVIYKVGEPDNALLVLDTKWKRVHNNKPEDADLKQMFVYNLYNGCSQSALLYPVSATATNSGGSYQGDMRHGSCKLIFLPLKRDEQSGMKLQLDELVKWINTCSADKKIINQGSV